MLPRPQAFIACTHAGFSQAPSLLYVFGSRGESQSPGPSSISPLASQDRTCEIVEDPESSRMVKKTKKRICLVLDCLCAHDFSDKTADLINLQHYVIKEKRLSERETVVIFYDVVRVVEALHQVRLRPSATSPLAREHPGPTSHRKPPFLLLVREAALSRPHPGVLCSWNSWKCAEGKWPDGMYAWEARCCRPQPTIWGVGGRVLQ